MSIQCVVTAGHIQLGREDAGPRSRRVLLRLHDDAGDGRHTGAEGRRQTADAVRRLLDGLSDAADSHPHHSRRLLGNILRPPARGNGRGTYGGDISVDADMSITSAKRGTGRWPVSVSVRPSHCIVLY